MTIKQPLLGQLTQGAIFSCARAERYSDCAVYGIVMTARCDLEQGKYNVLNYAPVVPLCDWLKVDGYEIAATRAESQLQSRIESALRSIDLPKSILNSQTPETILDVYIRANSASKKVAGAEAKFVDIVDRVKRNDQWQVGFSTDNADIFDSDNIGSAIIKELVKHRLSGYYFLDKIEPDGPESGFVALLREVTHLPRALAQLIAGGLEASDHAITDRKDWLAYIDFSHGDFAMPVGLLDSPRVEHLLQTFSFLFGRIGLPDTPDEAIDAFCRTRPIEQVIP